MFSGWCPSICQANLAKATFQKKKKKLLIDLELLFLLTPQVGYLHVHSEEVFSGTRRFSPVFRCFLLIYA